MVEYEIPAFEGSPSWCRIEYTYAVSDGADSAINFDPESLLFTFHQTTDLSLAGSDYTVTITARIGNIVVHSKTSTEEFTLTIRNPCTDSLYVSIIQLPLQNQ